MAYATVDDFIAVRGQQEAIELSNLDNPDVEGINYGVIDEALINASAEIDGHLALRYEVPIPFRVKLLRKMAIVIARKDLDRYGPPDHVRKDYDDVVEMLKRLAKGQELLIGDDGNVVPPSEENKAITIGKVGYRRGRRTFTHENLQTYGRELRWM